MKYNYVKTILGISLAVCTLYGSAREAYTVVTGKETSYTAPASSESRYENKSVSEERDDTTEGSSEAITNADPDPETPAVTLNDFLSGMRCGACGKNCSLLNPRCRNGMQKANAAKQEYYNTYPTATTENNSSNNNGNSNGSNGGATEITQPQPAAPEFGNDMHGKRKRKM